MSAAAARRALDPANDDHFAIGEGDLYRMQQVARAAMAIAGLYDRLRAGDDMVQNLDSAAMFRTLGWALDELLATAVYVIPEDQP